MAYFNFNLAMGRGINPKELMLLQIIKQNKVEDNSPFIAMMMDDDVLECLEGDKLIEYIKGKKSQSDFEKMRLTSKGEKMLADCQVPEVEEGDLQMFDYLSQMYLSHEDEDRIIGNKKKTKVYCATFRKHLGLSLHEMYWLCWLFLQERKFTKKLENIFFDSNKNRYGKFINNIEDSPLYQYYDTRKKDIEAFWTKKIEK